MPTAILLLPPGARFGGQRFPESDARALGRADRSSGDAGERAQLLRHFQLLPRRWPVAALTRQLDAGDAAHAAWLRADPVYIRPDINGARLLAHGEALRLERADCDALLPALRPLFGDTGFPLDAPQPTRWYLRLPREAKLPVFAEPGEALGADLFEYLPGADQVGGSEGRRWRALLSEAQVVLHNHPWNAQRQAAGKPPVNSLWFWGAGVLPDHVTAAAAAVLTHEPTLHALAVAAKRPVSALPARYAAQTDDRLIDLRDARDLAVLARDWLAPMLARLHGGELARITLDCADGAGFVLERRQRWRFWRKPIMAFNP